MYTFLTLSALLVLATASPIRRDHHDTDVADFDEHKFGYEFIFHDHKNLVLTIHGDNCYFMPLSDSNEEYLSQNDPDHFLTGTSRDITEFNIISKIQALHPSVQHTTLEEMRNVYKDLLADFHCAGKNIFKIIPQREDSDSDSSDEAQ